MATSHKRGQAVEHSYVTPVEIEEGGRLAILERSLEDLIIYVHKTTGKVCCGIIVAVGILVPLSMAIMGILFYEKCPAEKNITKYLLVGGLTTLLHIAIRCFTKKFRSFLTVLVLFSLGWFITGSVWIFALYHVDHNHEDHERYCDEQLFLFAFWITVGQYIMIIIVLIYLCTLCYLSLDV